jgi:hypothetical protein
VSREELKEKRRSWRGEERSGGHSDEKWWWHEGCVNGEWWMWMTMPEEYQVLETRRTRKSTGRKLTRLLDGQSFGAIKQ